MLKVFASIIAQRVKDSTEIEGWLHDYQFGFRAGYSTVDVIFILQTLFREK